VLPTDPSLKVQLCPGPRQVSTSEPSAVEVMQHWLPSPTLHELPPQDTVAGTQVFWHLYPGAQPDVVPLVQAVPHAFPTHGKPLHETVVPG
jgi:hypothetical protein